MVKKPNNLENCNKYFAEIQEYLGFPRKAGKFTLKSSYIAALIHARELTGRDIWTGKIVVKSKCGNWPGNLMYLILIDHIGLLFSANEDSKYNLGFKFALTQFTSLSDETINALYGLRCSFAHNFSLVNHDNKSTNKTRHLFKLVANNKNMFVKLPLSKYSLKKNDKISDLKSRNETVINLQKLGDLVESINDKILSLLKSDKLFLCEGGIDHLRKCTIKY